MKFPHNLIRPRPSILCALVLCAALLHAPAAAPHAQDVQQSSVAGQDDQSDVETRELVNDRFIGPRPTKNSQPPRRTKRRPADTSRRASDTSRRRPPVGATSRRTPPKAPPVYRVAPYSENMSYASPAAPLHESPTRGQRRADANTTGMVEKLIGVTVWRLRVAAPDDEARIIVHNEAGGMTREWTPVRAEAEADVSAGERIRITVESPGAGYLYVINRERYPDGTASAPFLIFPTLRTRGGDNRVEAGRLIEIPAQQDRPPYFNMNPSRLDQLGEELIIVVTERRLDFPISRNPLQLSRTQVREWEEAWRAKVVRLEQVGGSGRNWTLPERDAGSDEQRKLTQEEPLPQTIYRVKTLAGNPLLVKIPLTYRYRAGRD